MVDIRASSHTSAFVRQARYRARKAGRPADLQYRELAEFESELCECCGIAAAEHFTMAIPIGLGGAVVPANLMHVCLACRRLIVKYGLVALFHNETVSEKRFLEILGRLLARRGADEIRRVLRTLTGL